MIERLRPARGRPRRSGRLANSTPQSCLDSPSRFSKIRRFRQTAVKSAPAHIRGLRPTPRLSLAAFKSAPSQTRRSVLKTGSILARSKIGLSGGLANIRAPAIPVNVFSGGDV